MKEWGKGIGREFLQISHMKVEAPAVRTFVGASLVVREDPDTQRWVISLVSRSSREDVPVAWKATEKDALDWAQNYGMRK